MAVRGGQGGGKEKYDEKATNKGKRFVCMTRRKSGQSQTRFYSSWPTPSLGRQVGPYQDLCFVAAIRVAFHPECLPLGWLTNVP